MDAATVVKERVADLANHLDATRRTINRLQRERHDLLRQVEDAKSEVRAAREQLLLDRRKGQDARDEREALIVELGEQRKQLLFALHSARAKLGLTEAHVESLTDQLHRVKDMREAALSELSEASSALTDIRDQLRVGLREFTEGGLR